MLTASIIKLTMQGHACSTARHHLKTQHVHASCQRPAGAVHWRRGTPRALSACAYATTCCGLGRLSRSEACMCMQRSRG